MPTSPPNVLRNEFPSAATAAAAAPDIEQPVAEPNGVRWFKENGRARVSINGQRTIREWRVKTIFGHAFGPSQAEGAASMSRLEMFMNMIGLECFDNIIGLTNIELNKKGTQTTTRQEC